MCIFATALLLSNRGDAWRASASREAPKDEGRQAGRQEGRKEGRHHTHAHIHWREPISMIRQLT